MLDYLTLLLVQPSTKCVLLVRGEAHHFSLPLSTAVGLLSTLCVCVCVCVCVHRYEGDNDGGAEPGVGVNRGHGGWWNGEYV